MLAAWSFDVLHSCVQNHVSSRRVGDAVLCGDSISGHDQHEFWCRPVYGWVGRWGNQDSCPHAHTQHMGWGSGVESTQHTDMAEDSCLHIKTWKCICVCKCWLGGWGGGGTCNLRMDGDKDKRGGGRGAVTLYRCEKAQTIMFNISSDTVFYFSDQLIDSD